MRLISGTFRHPLLSHNCREIIKTVVWCLWWRNVWRPTTTCEIMCYRETHFTHQSSLLRVKYISNHVHNPPSNNNSKQQKQKKQEQQQPSATITNLHQTNHHQPLPTTNPCVRLSQCLDLEKHQQLSNLKTRANKKQTTTKNHHPPPRNEQLCMPEQSNK